MNRSIVFVTGVWLFSLGCFVSVVVFIVRFVDQSDDRNE